MLSEIPIDEYAATLDRCAEDLLWEANVDRPPVDAFELARRLRLRIASNEMLPQRAKFVRQATGSAGGLIVVGAEARPERRQWAVAHEIGESIAHRVFETLGVWPSDAPPLERERVANALGGRLLVPRRWLAGVANDVDGDLYAIKEVFATASHELIARRLLETSRGPLVVTITDNDALVWRRWNRPGAAPPIEPIEDTCRSQSHATAEPTWSDPGVCFDAPAAPLQRVRCWPIHEPSWRREIVFTELYDAA